LVSDITKIGDRNKNCYLAVVTDAYSKRIIAHMYPPVCRWKFLCVL